MRRRFFYWLSRLGGRHLGARGRGQTERNTVCAYRQSLKMCPGFVVEAVIVAPLRAVADDVPVSYPTHRSSPAGVGPVVELLFLAVASRPHLSHVSAWQRRSRPLTFALVFSAVAVDSFIALCHVFSGIGLPRLCGTPCRVLVSWVESERSTFSSSSAGEKIYNDTPPMYLPTL